MWRREDLREKKERDIQEEGTYTEGKHTLKHTDIHGKGQTYI